MHTRMISQGHICSSGCAKLGSKSKNEPIHRYFDDSHLAIGSIRPAPSKYRKRGTGWRSRINRAQGGNETVPGSRMVRMVFGATCSPALCPSHLRIARPQCTSVPPSNDKLPHARRRAHERDALLTTAPLPSASRYRPFPPLSRAAQAWAHVSRHSLGLTLRPVAAGYAGSIGSSGSVT